MEGCKLEPLISYVMCADLLQSVKITGRRQRLKKSYPQENVMKNEMAMMETKYQAEAEYQAEADLDTLLRSEEIRADKKRMGAVCTLAKEKLVNMAKISVLKDEKPETKGY